MCILNKQPFLLPFFHVPLSNIVVVAVARSFFIIFICFLTSEQSDIVWGRIWQSLLPILGEFADAATLFDRTECISIYCIFIVYISSAERHLLFGCVHLRVHTAVLNIKAICFVADSVNLMCFLSLSSYSALVNAENPLSTKIRLFSTASGAGITFIEASVHWCANWTHFSFGWLWMKIQPAAHHSCDSCHRAFIGKKRAWTFSTPFLRRFCSGHCIYVNDQVVGAWEAAKSCDTRAPRTHRHYFNWNG